MTESQLDDYLRGDFEYQTVEELLESDFEDDLDYQSSAELLESPRTLNALQNWLERETQLGAIDSNGEGDFVISQVVFNQLRSKKLKPFNSNGFFLDDFGVDEKSKTVYLTVNGNITALKVDELNEDSDYDYTGYFDDLNEETNIDIVEDDDIKIPEGFKYVAVDGDGTINVFKEKPTIQKGEFDTWRGDGRSEIGQAVWNFSKLPGKPEDSKAAFPEISKILKDYVFEIKDDLDLGAKLDDKGMFKIVFPKYHEIEKL